MAVFSSLGYKNAVAAVYEKKLIEARQEAQQDCHYAADGDVSSFLCCRKLTLQVNK